MARAEFDMSGTSDPPALKPGDSSPPDRIDMEGRSKSVLGRTLHYLAPFLLARWKMLVGAVAAVLTGTAVELLKPWPLKFVFDYLLQGASFLPPWAMPPGVDTRTWLLVIVCALIVLVYAGASAFAYLKEYLLNRLGEEVVFELRAALFGHIQRLSLTFHDSRRIGDMTTRVTRDAEAVRDLMGPALLQWAVALTGVASTLVVMAYMDLRLSLVGVITVAILFPVEWRLKRRIQQASKRKREREVEITSVTQETMTALPLVKAFGREGYQEQQFGRQSSESARAGVETARLEAQYVRSVDIIIAMAMCGVVWWGVRRVFDGALTPGDLYVFAHYVRGLHGPLRDIAKASIKMARGRVGLERILEALDTVPAVQDSPSARAAPRFRGRVEFQTVSFAYHPGQPVLDDVSFRIEPGQTVALVGNSGAGKSTILSLIPRLYEPSSGRILIDGEDIRTFRLDSLREQTAFVLQESVLFQATILENILYGRPEANAEEVRQAIEAARVDQFVGRLKRGVRTVVGPRGATLSGGERQRVAIARAMIRRAPILLLDEPTTGLDVESEKLVMEALERLMEGKTTLLIGHKLTLIERADHVLVIDRGRIVESGTPAELEAAGGMYARLRELAAANGVIQDRPEQPVIGVRRYGS
jgi:ATP-binding cassette, subfamily B, bacterial